MSEIKQIEEPIGQGMKVTFYLDEVLVDLQTPHQHLIIAQTPAYGRALFLDRLIQSSEADEVLYHEPLIHPAVVIHGGPRRVLVGGAGEGASMRELLRHESIETIVAVDLDPQVVAACREHLPQWHRGSYDDPRVELRYEDIQATLANSPDGSWDMIVLDITDPVDSGPSVDLFTQRFFTEVARALADDGIVVLQAGELDPIDLEMARSVRCTLEEVFPWNRMLHTFVPSFHAIWSIRLAAKQDLEAEPADLEQRIQRIRRIQSGDGDSAGELKMYDAMRHRSMLHLPRFMQQQLDHPGEVITGEDDARLIPYDIER